MRIQSFHDPAARQRLLVLFLAGVAVAVQLGWLARTDYSSYPRDPFPWWLQAWALRDGADLYTPLPELAARYAGDAIDHFPHPSPYPPVFAVAALPLSLLPYWLVPPLWLAASYALLLPIGRRLGLSRGWSLALAAWPPVMTVLSIGQVEVALLAVCLLGWQAGRRGQDGRAGLWLGLAAALKLYPALFLLPFVARRRWRLVGAAAAVGLAAQAVNLALVGPAALWRYYTAVLPSVGAHWARLELNASAYSAIQRLFEGTELAAPPVDAPALVVPLAVVCALVGLVPLLRLEPEAAPAALPLLLPTAWVYHVALALPWLLARWRVGGAGDRLGVALASCSPPLNGIVAALLLFAAGYHGGDVPGIALLGFTLQPLGLLLVVALALQPRLSRRGSPAPARAPAPRRPQAQARSG